MNQIRGFGGVASSPRFKKAVLSAKGKKALAALHEEAPIELIQSAHRDSSNLRQFAERFAKRKRPEHESMVKLELDHATGDVSVNIYDEVTGNLEMKMTPDELMESLRQLENTKDLDSPLSSFFVDLKI